jgi:hypothetical protein
VLKLEEICANAGPLTLVHWKTLGRAHEGKNI